MPTALKQTIQDAVKDAMRAKDAPRLGTLRMLTASIKQIEIDTQSELSDQEVVGVIRKMIKQRKESIAQYQKGNRPDLVQAENDEIDVLSGFLPQSLSSEELEALISAAIKETGASSMRDMKKLMPLLSARIDGRADMADVSAILKAKLTA